MDTLPTLTARPYQQQYDTLLCFSFDSILLYSEVISSVLRVSNAIGYHLNCYKSIKWFMMGDVTAASPTADDLNNSGSSSSSSSDSDGESSSSCSSSSSSCSETPINQCNNSCIPNCNQDTPKSNGQSEWIVCQLCLHKVKTPLQLKQHMRMHTEHKIHRCAICNKSFEQATRLEKHIAIHCDSDNRFECSLCGKVYKLRTQIVSHIAAHKKQNAGRRISYTCHICTKKFSNKSKLKEHVSGHENGTLHSCDVCGRTFKLNSYLVVHKRTHEMNVSYTGDKPFTCSLCSKSFLSKSNLDLHMLVHNYVKKASYSCDICGKIFMRKYNYDAHVKIHQ